MQYRVNANLKRPCCSRSTTTNCPPKFAATAVTSGLYRQGGRSFAKRRRFQDRKSAQIQNGLRTSPDPTQTTTRAKQTTMGCAPSKSHHTSTGNGTGGSSPCHSRGSGSGGSSYNDNAYESSRGASYSPTAAYDGGWGGSWSPVSRNNSNCSAGSACSGGSGGW